MRYIRYRDQSGMIRLAIEQPAGLADEQRLFLEANEGDLVEGLQHGFTPSYRSVSTDPEVLALPPELTLLTPLDAPETWCASVNHPESMVARLKESDYGTLYEELAEHARPYFHFKDAGGRRTVASGEPLAIRSDATWTVPEPEIGIVLGDRGSILGYTIVNDLSCRDIRGASPFFLSQAKSYRSSCAIGPTLYADPGRRKGFTVYMRIAGEDGTEVFSAKATTSDMRSSFDTLIAWLIRDNPLPAGTILSTGATIVPPHDFTLHPGQVIEIHVPEIGTLVNPVVLVADLEDGDVARARREALLRNTRAQP